MELRKFLFQTFVNKGFKVKRFLYSVIKNGVFIRLLALRKRLSIKNGKRRIFKHGSLIQNPAKIECGFQGEGFQNRRIKTDLVNLI